MSRNYRKSSKGIIGGIIAVLATLFIVGGLGALTKGFRDWSFEDVVHREKDNRLGLVKLDLTTDKSGSKLNTTSVISLLNEKVQEPIFKEVKESSEENIKNVYQDNGGLKFGSASEVGKLAITLVDSYQFNRVKLIGRNYSAYLSTSSTYNCDECAVKVNSSEKQTFLTNASDNTKIAPTEEKIFEFDSMQSELMIEGEEVNGKRFTLFGIELWSVIDEVEEQTSSDQ